MSRSRSRDPPDDDDDTKDDIETSQKDKTRRKVKDTVDKDVLPVKKRATNTKRKRNAHAEHSDTPLYDAKSKDMLRTQFTKSKSAENYDDTDSEDTESSEERYSKKRKGRRSRDDSESETDSEHTDDSEST